MDRDFTARGNHDMGGLTAGEINKNEHDYALWEKRVDAIMMLLTNDLRIIIPQSYSKSLTNTKPHNLICTGLRGWINW